MFYCIFKKDFSKFVLLIVVTFYENFPNISKQFLKIFYFLLKSKIKTIIFQPKLAKNHYTDTNLAKFSPKTTKNGHFSLKNLYFFETVGAFGAKNLYLWYSKNPIFLYLGRLRQYPLTHLWYIRVSKPFNDNLKSSCLL